MEVVSTELINGWFDEFSILKYWYGFIIWLIVWLYIDDVMTVMIVIWFS